MRVNEMRVNEMRVNEMRVNEMRINEMRINEMRVNEMRVNEMRLYTGLEELRRDGITRVYIPGLMRLVGSWWTPPVSLLVLGKPPEASWRNSIARLAPGELCDRGNTPETASQQPSFAGMQLSRLWLLRSLESALCVCSSVGGNDSDIIIYYKSVQ